MNTKKIVIIGLILIAASTCLSAIATASDSNFVVNGNTISIHNIEFNIPDGYTEDESKRDTTSGDSSGWSTDTHEYQTQLKNSDKVINISIRYTEGASMTEYTLGDDSKTDTINGHSGSYVERDGNAEFAYIVDGEGIRITAPDRSTLEEVIK